MFIVEVVLVVTGLVLTHLSFSGLKAKCPEIWSELGCPNLLLNNSLSHNFRWIHFLYSGGYKCISDSFLRVVVRVLSLVNLLAVLWLIFAIYVVIINQK